MFPKHNIIKAQTIWFICQLWFFIFNSAILSDVFMLLQTWSSQDLSLGLEMSRDPFLQVLVPVLVLKPRSLGLGLGFGTSESWSWSWSWNLGLWRLGLRHSWSVKLRQNRKSYVKLQRYNVQSAASIARKSLLSACHLCSCGTDI